MFSANSQESHIIDKSQLKGSIAELQFVNTATNALPVEENPNNKPHKVRGYNFSRVKPTPRENPRIVSLSAPALALLDLDKERVEKDPDTPHYLSGNKEIPTSNPVAQCYCGHQFGSFAGQLGDGRAITLGDIKNQKGELWELQFKGSGITPYSRFADGKAVLRSSIREYLCSEAMWALGIPTTRAASLIVTDSLAERDPLYSGRNIMEKCAIVLRQAPTLWRFGTFEIFKKSDPYTGENGPSEGLEEEMLAPMLDYLLNNHYSDIAKLEKEQNLSHEDCYFEMFKEISRRTAYVVALWQCYGFCHGVLNTDNMSILGLTIDYGPFGWMDYFDKKFICNHSDESGRYSYENQPSVCKWNLIKLAEAIQAKVPLQKTKSYVEAEYDKTYNEYYYSKMREKLGLYCVESKTDIELIDSLFDVMHANGSDFTNTFRKLAQIAIPKNLSESGITKELIEELLDLSPSMDTILDRYRPRFSEAQIQQLKQMAKGNVEFLMIMGLSPSIIEQEEEKINKYKEIQQQDEGKIKEGMKEKWQNWVRKYEERLFLETSALKMEEESEESKNNDLQVKKRFKTLKEMEDYRRKRMNNTNPIYILRNYMAEEAIRKAEKEDFSGVNNLLDLLLNPFDARDDTYEGKEYTKLPPKWAAEICVSCSS